MKNTIIKILRTGYTTSKKYKVTDFPYFLRPIFEDCNVGDITIKCNDNKFWHHSNNDNRLKLIDDMKGYHKNISKGTTFHIINEYENGNAYGMEKR